MALVAYDYDSNSEHEEENEEEEVTSSQVILNKLSENNSEFPYKSNENNRENNNQEDADIPEELEISKESEIPESDGSISKLLSVLPKTIKISPATVVAQEDDKIEDFIPKWQPVNKEKKEKVKITIPSLSQFDDEEDFEPKRAKLNPSKGSGLLSILPPVKGSPLTTTSFVPKVLSKKPTTTTTSNNSLVPNAVRKKAELQRNAVLKRNMKKPDPIKEIRGSNEDSDDDDVEIPETFDDDMWQKVCGRPKPKEIIKDEEDSEAIPMNYIDLAPEPVKPYDGLDNTAFKELVGKSKRPQNIKLVDINEEEVLPDKDVWLAKSLTDPEQAPKPVVENPVDPTKRKKHHITFLAEQAKANEQDFKNQWAASKYTRNQTRAKYGF